MTKSKKSSYTLIRRSALTETDKRATTDLFKDAGRRSKTLRQNLGLIEKTFTSAWGSSVQPRKRLHPKSALPKTPTPAERIVRSGTRGGRSLEVGVLDLGAWFAALPELLERLNKGQTQFTFFEVQAPLPGGLLKSGAWYVKVKDYQLTKSEKAELSTQIYANEFFGAGRNIRLHFGLQYLVGITPAQIAGIDRGSLYWNHFSTSNGPELLISTADLRSFAAKAQRSFEVLVGYLLIAQLLAESNSRVRFHRDRGCLFDYNKSRVSIAQSAAKPTIEPKCLERIQPENRETALKFMQVLGKL